MANDPDAPLSPRMKFFAMVMYGALIVIVGIGLTIYVSDVQRVQAVDPSGVHTGHR